MRDRTSYKDNTRQPAIGCELQELHQQFQTGIAERSNASGKFYRLSVRWAGPDLELVAPYAEHVVWVPQLPGGVWGVWNIVLFFTLGQTTIILSTF